MKTATFARWQMHSADVRGTLQLPATATPYTGKSEISFGGHTMNQRQRDLLDCAFAARRSDMPDTSTSTELRAGLWCDISQAVQRRPWGLRPPSICRNTCLYSYEHDVVLTGYAHMLLLGWPRGFAGREEFTSTELRDLSGEAVSIPITSIILQAYWCNPWAPWW